MQNKKKYLSLALSIVCAQLLLLVNPMPTHALAECPTLEPGDTFKANSTSAVYLLNPQERRAVFANADVYLSWYSDFSGVKTIPDECVAAYPTGPSVPYRPGSRLVKGVSPNVYMVTPGSKLIKIESEEVARGLYGEQWTAKVRVLEDFHFNSYVRTDETISGSAPHDGMLVEQDGFVYYVENNIYYEVREYPEDLGNLDIIKLDASEDEPIPTGSEVISFEEINKRNILDGSMNRLLGEQKIVSVMFEQAEKILSARQKSTTYFNGIGEEVTELSDDPILQTFFSGRVVADSKIDALVCNSEKSQTTATLETKNSDGTYTKVGTIEATTIGNGASDDATAYFKMSDFAVPQSESAFIYEIILDKWIRFNANEFESQISDPSQEADTERDALAGIAKMGRAALTPPTSEACDTSALFDASFDIPHLISVTENLGETTINGVPVHHFAFTIDRSTLRKLLRESTNTLNEDFDADSFDSIGDIIGLMDEGMDIRDAEVWIGTEDLLPRKLTITLIPFDDYTGEKLGEITYEVEFSEFNSTFIIKAPEQTVSLFEILEALVEALFSQLEEEYNTPTEELIEKSNVLPVDEARDHIYGNPDATITVIEYGDLECPYCATFHPNMKELVQDYDGDVRWVYRHYPLASIHPRSVYLAHVSECAADKNKFWESLDAIFADSTKDVTAYAYDLGISGSELSNCVQTKRHEEKIQEDMANGKLIGVTGVPYTIIIDEFGNETIVEGARSYEYLEDIVLSYLGITRLTEVK